MTKSFDDPIYFQEKKSVCGIDVEYIELSEICQGGPAIGKLKINGKIVDEHLLFGGPFLIEGMFIFIPVFTKKYLRSGFKLCRINIYTKNYKILDSIRDLIFLYSIENNRILFFEDLKKTMANFYDKNEFGD
jgi:hypothetical protein